MPIAIFAVSYLTGLAGALVEQEQFVLYTALFLLYVNFMALLKDGYYKKIAEIPLLLSLSSSVIIAFLGQEPLAEWSKYIYLIIFIWIVGRFRGKKDILKKERNSGFHTADYLLSAAAPVGIYFLVLIAAKDNEMSASIFLLAYMLCLSALAYKIINKAELIFFLLSQSAVCVYLSQFADGVQTAEKVLVAANVILAGCIQYKESKSAELRAT